MKIARPVRAFSLTAVCLVILSTRALAATYDESVDGDLSGIATSPTVWMLESGSNRLTGSAFSAYAETSPGVSVLVGFDYDLVAFTIPAGHQLDSIVVDSYVNVTELAQSFIALQAGSPWLNTFGWDIDGSKLMGYTHVHSYMPIEKTDILVDIQNVFGSFDLPLPSGVYTMLLEDIDSFFTYSLVFNVSAVPEPSSAMLGGIGVAILALRRRARAGAR